MNFDYSEIGAKIGLYFIPFLFSLCFHEYAHGWVAQKLGDNTAKLMGRLTMNPLAHADLFGTLIFPIVSIISGLPFFGWANPVPVNDRNFKHPRKAMFWVASAGPLSNVLLAFIGIVLKEGSIYLIKDYHQLLLLQTFLRVFVQINLFLAFFNLIPLHPLDGGKVLARFLPEPMNRKLEENQNVTSMILILLFFTGALQLLVYPVYIFESFLTMCVQRVVG